MFSPQVVRVLTVLGLWYCVEINSLLHKNEGYHHEKYIFVKSKENTNKESE